MAPVRMPLVFCFALAACGSNQPVSNGASEDAPKVAQTSENQSSSGESAKPAYFLSGEDNQSMLAAIRRNVEPKIGFNGHYSIAYVECGTGCGSYWFVDRRDGAIVASPNLSADGQMVWDVAAKRESDVLKVTYGSQDGSTDHCVVQSFRWTGYAFEQLSEKQAIDCPE